MALSIAVFAVCGFVVSASGDAHSYGGLNFAFPNVSTPQPFKISVDPAFIEQSLAKVKMYRPSRDVSEQWTNEGPARANITQLASDWVEDYNWFDIEEQINTNFSHFATTVPGSAGYKYPIPLHFVHERSSEVNAIPLLLLHGWPSTHLEWSKVIDPLTSQSERNVSFHIVAPDLPGFGFSPAPTHPGMGAPEMAGAFNSLMHQLGYDRYGVASTDIGWEVAIGMVQNFESNIIGHFTDFFLATPNATDLARFENNQTTAEENTFILGMNAWESSHAAYAIVHSQKPLALALAMSDSPVGFAGWVWDLQYIVSYYPPTTEQHITNTMMLWIQGTYGSFRSYLEILAKVRKEVFKPLLLVFRLTLNSFLFLKLQCQQP
jgi:hypothetical protein